jgi:hypothetical protein
MEVRDIFYLVSYNTNLKIFFIVWAYVSINYELFECWILLPLLLPAFVPFYLMSAQHTLFLLYPLSVVISSLISCLTQSITFFLVQSFLRHPSTFMFITLLATCFSTFLVISSYQLKWLSFISVNKWNGNKKYSYTWK